MASYESLLKGLDIQEKIEGPTENIALCRLVVPHLKTGMDVQAFFDIRFHRYAAKHSYQAHKFLYVKENIKALFLAVADAGKEKLITS